ncbi:hypothetical protein [Rhizobium sp. LjRoot254]|uniref:hypothetical protein n=1 Tax=Rhizobium sp. LjRoot254 TaxID=3342297 RepID=UPI003ECEC8B1
MSTDCSRLFRALLEPHPEKPTRGFLVIPEENLIAVETLRMTLDDQQKVQALAEEVSAQPIAQRKTNYELRALEP